MRTDLVTFPVKATPTHAFLCGDVEFRWQTEHGRFGWESLNRRTGAPSTSMAFLPVGVDTYEVRAGHLARTRGDAARVAQLDGPLPGVTPHGSVAGMVVFADDVGQIRRVVVLFDDDVEWQDITP